VKGCFASLLILLGICLFALAALFHLGELMASHVRGMRYQALLYFGVPGLVCLIFGLKMLLRK